MSMIFLVGMPGAGKTYWGKKIAAEYGWQFTDLDAYIETAEGRSIPAIFREDGENIFREKEQAALVEIIGTATGRNIVACGGGTPAFFNNADLMKRAGCVVYLRTAIDILVQRIQTMEQRPLLANATDMAAALAALHVKREPFYMQAGYIVDTQNISVLTFEKIIQECTDRV